MRRYLCLKKKCLYSLIAAVVYHIWRVRNDVLWLDKLWTIRNTVQRINKEVQLRLKLVLPKKASRKDQEWLDSFCKK